MWPTAAYSCSVCFCAHIVGAFVGLFLAAGGRWTPALVVWLLIAAGAVPRRSSASLVRPAAADWTATRCGSENRRMFLLCDARVPAGRLEVPTSRAVVQGR